MFSLEWLLRNLHVLSNLFWIGSIVAVGVLVSTPAVAPKERGILARIVYLRLATPAFVLSFLTGLLRLVLDSRFYFVDTHFMHAKLPLALGVIALHHVLGKRARLLAEGKVSVVGAAPAMTAGTAVLAAAAAWLALTKPF